MAMLGLWGRGMADALGVVRRERGLTGRGGAPAGSPWSDLGGDVKYALRGWRRSPGFSITVVGTLALGLGLAAAIFSFADGYLFRPLPFPGGDRTYYVRDPNAPIALLASDVVALRTSPVAEYGFVEWSAGHLYGELVIGDRRVPISSYDVSPRFRDTLKLPLVAGRDFTPDDHLAGAPIVAWLAHRFWQREFGGDPGVVGRTFRVEGPRGVSAVHVAGILSREVASFDLNNALPDLVVPVQGPRAVGPNNLSFPLVLVPEGRSVEQATQQIAAALEAVAPAADGRPRVVRLRSLVDAQLAGGRPAGNCCSPASRRSSYRNRTGNCSLRRAYPRAPSRKRLLCARRRRRLRRCL
jgi:hypothetical protein